MKNKWVLSLVLALLLIFGQLIMPITTYAVSDPLSYTFDISEGDITISAGSAADTIQVTYGAAADTTPEFPDTQPITIIGTTSNRSNALLDTAHKVVVDGVTANITLNGVSIDNIYSGACAFEMKNGADVALTTIGINALTSGDFAAGLKVEAGNTLNILGPGTLNATGGYQSAAIGGRTGGTAGTITITGGTVNAIGGTYATGIGGGNGGAGGAVTIMAAAQVNASANGAAYNAIQTASGSLEGATTARVLMANLKNTLTVHTLAEIRVKSNNNSGGWIPTPWGCGSVAFTAPAETYQLFFAGFNIQQHPGGTDFVLPTTPGFTIYNDVEDAPMAPDLVDLVLSSSNNYTFVGSTYTYSGVTVANGVSSITVTPTGAGIIKVNNVVVTSGQPSGPIALTAGVQKTITVVETQEGKNSKTYTIYITRVNADQAAPTLLNSVAPTAYGASNGKITGTTAAMQYKAAAAGTYLTCSETETTGLPSGTYNVRFAAKAGFNASPATDVIIANGPNADQAAPTTLNSVAPTVYGASDGKITGTTAAMQYKAAASGTYLTCSATETTGLPAGTYNVRYAAQPGLNASPVVDVTIAEGPNAAQAAPTLLNGVAPTAYGASDGKITGTTTAMQYKRTADSTYLACSATETIGLAAGTYNVRYAAKTGFNASPATDVTIADGPNADQAPPTLLNGVAPTSYGAHDGKISGTTTAMQYKRSADSTYLACSATETTGLAAGTYNVRYAAQVGLNASPAVDVTIAEGLYDQTAPTGLIGIAPTAYAANDGKITGTTAAMQYKRAADSTYTTCSETETTGLAAGTYNVRYAAKAGFNASPTATVTLADGVSSGSTSGAGGKTDPVIRNVLTAELTVTSEGVTASSTTITATLDLLTQSVSAQVDPSMAQELIAEALEAKAAGKKAVATVRFGAVPDAIAFSAEIPRAEFRQMAVAKTTLELKSDIGSISLGTNEIASIGRAAATGNITLGIEKIDTSALSAKAQAKVGNNPLYQFDVSIGDTKVSSISGSAKITLPYTPKAGEKKKTVTIYYVDSKGTLRSAPGRYDAKTKTVGLSISRF